MLTGPRRAGKTSLLRPLFPNAEYFLLEAPDIIARFQADPSCFRDAQGLEVDFLMPGRSGALTLIECKDFKTVTPGMAAPMQRLDEVIRAKRDKAPQVECLIVHHPPQTGTRLEAVSPGVRAVAWQDFVQAL